MTSLAGLELSGLAVLCGDDDAFSITLPRPLKLLVNQNRFPGKVNTIPGQAKYLAFPHPSEQRHKEQMLVFLSANCFQKIGDKILVHWVHFLFLYSGAD